jgi:hypothetical protein
MKVFSPDNQAATHGKAKHFSPRFAIRFRMEYSFVDSAGTSETIMPRDYESKFYWHEDQGGG